MKDIPVVILCGGQGTRMRGNTLTKKELVEIGGRPVIWHVMRIFSAHGHNRFLLTLGFQAEQIRRYFLEYEAMHRDFTVQLGEPSNRRNQPQLEFHGAVDHPPWRATLVDTGLYTEKGSRIARVKEHLRDDERFFVAYGDDVADVDLTDLVAFHEGHGRLATVTSVQVDFQYGVLETDETDRVTAYRQYPRLPYWINGGFMLFEHPVLDLFANGDDVKLESDVLASLAQRGELMCYRHTGFWQSMNTMKDNILLEELWQQDPPWKVW
jgi:glucose-1-phosphate cytidylyltransferase